MMIEDDGLLGREKKTSKPVVLEGGRGEAEETNRFN